MPTPAEIMGDFSMSNVKIYDPTTAVANPNYNPALPTGPSTIPYTRSQFPTIRFPRPHQSAARSIPDEYVPHAEHDDDDVVQGADSNNYLDIRNETHYQDQGTVRLDHNFSE